MTAEINAWAKIGSDCSMKYLISRLDNSVEIHFGGQWSGLDIDLTPNAVRRLADMTAKAVHELDEQAPSTDSELAE
jgi:protein tyrosine/serine phosphatase